MKRKIFIALLIASLLLLLPLPLVPVKGQTGDWLFSNPLVTPVTIDGAVGTGEWADAYKRYIGYKDAGDTFVSIKHDSECLYILMDVTGDDTQNARDGTYIFFDVGNRTKWEEEQAFYTYYNTTYYNYTSIHFSGGPSEFCCYCNATLHPGLAFQAGFGTSPDGATNHTIVEFKIPFSLLPPLTGAAGESVGAYLLFYDDYSADWTVWPPVWHPIPANEADLKAHMGDLKLLGAPRTRLYSNPLLTNVTIDGAAGADEWADAYKRDLGGNASTFISIKHDSNFLYILLDATNDTTQNHNDTGYLFFDIDNDAIWANESSFRIYYNATTSTYTTEHLINLTRHCYFNSTLHPGIAGAGGFGSTPDGFILHEIYEYKIPLNMLGMTGAAGQTVGLYVLTKDYASTKATQWPPGAKYPQTEADLTTIGELELRAVPPVPIPFLYSSFLLRNVTVDGAVGVGEWADAYKRDLGGNASTFISIKHDSDYLYVLLDATNDTTQNHNDTGYLFFDIDNDAIWANETSFYIHYNATTSTYTTEHLINLTRHCYFNSTLHPGIAGAGGFGTSPDGPTNHEIYEYKIPLNMLNMTGAANETVGLYVLTKDYASTKATQWPPGAKYPQTEADLTTIGDLILSYGPPLYSNPLVTPVTMDGAMGTGEWADAYKQDLGGTAGTFIFIKHYADFLYILLDLTNDTTQNNNDMSWLFFDVGNDAIWDEEQTFYIYYYAPWNNYTSIHYSGFYHQECCAPFNSTLHPGIAGAGGFGTSPDGPTNHNIFEYKIPLNLLGMTGAAGETVGFYLLTMDYITLVSTQWPPTATWPTLEAHLGTLGDIVLLPARGVGITSIASAAKNATGEYITPAKTVVGQGLTKGAYYKVVIENIGDFTETGINVALYYQNATGDYLIGTQTGITLNPHQIYSYTFTWDTKSVKRDRIAGYTIFANITAVTGENCTADNTYVFGNVKVVIPGNFNADPQVNVVDLGKMGVHWLAKVGESLYNANVDVSCDGTINVVDLGTLGVHWLEYE